jgi:hypothetical protein
MLTCLPQSLCSWNYRVTGAPSGEALLTFNVFNEQGTITLGGVELAVRKHGWASGQWSLERAGETYASAQKPSALFRSYDIQCGDSQITVKAYSPFSRCFNVLDAGALVGTIEPVHLFTRRATVECSDSVPELAQLFAFWLAVIAWRRQAKSNNS